MTRGDLMSQQSKLRPSRQQWKQKAKERAEPNRYLRKELERIRKERDHAQQALKAAQEHLRHKAARPATLKAQRVGLALTLLAGARISFRAVSRVLPMLAHWLGIGKAPCPQTVINWVRRLSVVRLQSVRLLQGVSRRLFPCTTGLLWMIDTSITRGTGKLLRVLALDAHHSQLAGDAPGFPPVRCVAVAVAPAWTGERLADLLERVIAVGAARRPTSKTAAASCTKPSACGPSGGWGARCLTTSPTPWLIGSSGATPRPRSLRPCYRRAAGCRAASSTRCWPACPRPRAKPRHALCMSTAGCAGPIAGWA